MLPRTAQGSLPACRAQLWPGGIRTRWTTYRISERNTFLPNGPALPGRIYQRAADAPHKHENGCSFAERTSPFFRQGQVLPDKFVPNAQRPHCATQTDITKGLIWAIHLTGVSDGPNLAFNRRPRSLRRRALQAVGMATPLGGHGWHLPRSSTGDELLIAQRLVDHGQLEHTIEQHAAAAGTAAVEAKHELVEVVAHVDTVGGPLMRSQQPPLGQRDDAVYGGQQLVGIVALSACGPLTAPFMLVANLRQSLIGWPAVGDDHRTRLDVIHHEAVQRLGRGVGQGRDPTPTKSPGFSELDRDCGQHLLALGAATRASPGSAPPM